MIHGFSKNNNRGEKNYEFLRGENKYKPDRSRQKMGYAKRKTEANEVQSFPSELQEAEEGK